MERALADRHKIIRLFDAYGTLLTTRQQRLVRLYYLDDLSLGEIATRLEITRQAVFDSVRRSVDELQRLETSLQVLAHRDQRMRRQQHLARRLTSLEEAINGLRRHVTPEKLGPIADQLAALWRAVR